MKLELLGLLKAKINQLQKQGINSVEDLLNYHPTSYLDYSKVTKIRDLKEDENRLVIGIISKIAKPKPNIISITIEDDSFKNLYVTLFNQAYLFNKFKVGDNVLCAGKVSVFGKGYFSMSNPHLLSKDLSKLGIIPVYKKIKGMSQEYLQTQINNAINTYSTSDYLEPEILKKYSLIPSHIAFEKIHKPTSLQDIEIAKERILFDELFQYNYELISRFNQEDNQTTIDIQSVNNGRELIKDLPYQLTRGQNEVLAKIVEKFKKKEKVNALIQGDVGCGKTIIAFILANILVENNYQCVIAAPTNILAKQHYLEAIKHLQKYNINIEFISSECKQSEIKKIKERCKSGETQILIGTHSVFNVEFKNLGLIIVDEEHKFGVKQRTSLDSQEIHKISLSATPIPRSLALSLYGEGIDIYTINTMPVNRKPIKTYINSNNIPEMFKKIEDEIKLGHQAYIVCPIIKDSESESLLSIEKISELAEKYFIPKGINIGVITGEQKDKEIEERMELYKNNDIQLLIATTIIEVGVNIPNASIIVLFSADRFGYAQIHQLRGRVGRSNIESSCYICSDLTPDKFEIFERTNDGFEIAQEDLKRRGSGGFLGTNQSGYNKYLMLMLSHEQLNELIKEEVREILKNDSRNKWYTNFNINE